MKNYDEYRKEIKEITTRNKGRIPILKLLNELGINKGNYYAFLNNARGSKASTLSYEKLDNLLSSLIALDGDATNMDKLNQMSVDQYAKFIENTFVNNPDRSKIDIKAWLKSNEPKLKYKEK